MALDHRLPSSASPPEKALRVLLVDDDSAHLALARRRMARLPLTVSFAKSGDEALRVMASNRFDVVGLDVNLGDRNGLDILQELRGRGDDTPVVFITGLNDAKAAVDALKAGAKDFIVKSGEQEYFDLLGSALRSAHESETNARGKARAEATRDELMREMAHRIKNQFAVVTSIATSSGRGAEDVTTFVQDFSGRIQAISRAYDLLFAANWEALPLEDVVHKVLRPTLGDSYSADLPPVCIDSQTTQSISLALHELAVNALRYGNIGRDGTHISLNSDIDIVAGERAVILKWSEHGGREVQEPRRHGYGLRMVHNVFGQLGGSAHFSWTPTGVHITMSFKIEA